MASTPVGVPLPSNATPSVSNSSASRFASSTTGVRHSQSILPESTSNDRAAITASAAEVSNPEHPHHRHHRNIQDFELMETLGEGSYSTVCTVLSATRSSPLGKLTNFV